MSLVCHHAEVGFVSRENPFIFQRMVEILYDLGPCCQDGGMEAPESLKDHIGQQAGLLFRNKLSYQKYGKTSDKYGNNRISIV